MGGEIMLVPVGEVERGLLEHLCAAVSEQFERPCRIGKPLSPALGYAYDARRGQYAAETILRQLQAQDAERVLAVIDRDLYVPQLNFVFGLADRRERRALIALPRLREQFYGGPADEALFRRRAVKEAVHELGHTYGLGHCNNSRCVMAFSNTLRDTDHKAQTFCERCQAKIEDKIAK